MDKRKVELIFDATEAPSFDSNLQDIERKQAEALRRMQGGIDIGAAGMSGGAMSPGMALPPSASHDALQNALGSTGGDVPWRELVDAVRALTEITSESADTARKTNETARRNLAWQQANALMNLGNQTVNQVAQGNFFGAAGGAVGGLLGLPFGPAGMAAGASIGGMAGNFLQGLSTGAGGARAYTADATDLARRFGGLDQLSPLQDYGLGSEQGYKVEETLSQMGRLQASRVAGNAGEAAQLIPAIQQLTRALGLNAEATIDLYQGYVQTGGDRGSDGLRDYMAQVVGGAISAGFESNIQMYGEFMNSARTQSVSQSGSLMSDRAFGQLQGVLANLTGTDSQASRFFKENPQLAEAGMGAYMSMGGAGDPYSTQAGYLRLAGVEEHQIDRRFIDQETQMVNASKAMGFLGDQMMQHSGMSREDFQAAAASDPNFVREQMAGNVNLQRLMGTQLLPGLIGRDATAQDLRAFEQLSNISIANGGQLPTGTAEGAGKVDELLAQLNASPADQARQAEAERHNKQMEVMSNFQNLMTKTDEWMANIYGWISDNLDLAAIEETILAVMDRFGTFVTDTALPFIEDQAIPFITDQAIPFVQEGTEAAKALAQWAKDNNIAEKFGAVGRIAGARSYEEFTSGDTGVGFDGKFDGPLSNFVKGVAARFNDTPGHGVTAREGYNTFQFAEGDQVFAFQGGGNTLGDLLKALEDILGAGIGHSELTKELHDERFTLAAEQFDLLALTEEHQAAITEYQTEQTEKIFPLMEAHLGAISDATSFMASIDQSIRDLIGVTVDIATMVQTLQSLSGGMGGPGGPGGGGAFASGLFTGPSANIGGSSAYHIDTKFNKSQSWEQIAGYFDQMAEAYAADDRRIEFSNSGVAGETYDHTAGLDEKIKLLRRAAAAHDHSIHANWHSFDYYVPQGGESRHGASAAGAEMMLPSVSGGRVEYGQASDYGNFANILDADGNVVIKTGHGDNRRTLPSSRDLPTATAGGGIMPDGLTVKGRDISSDQYQIARRIYQRGKQLGATDNEIRAAIATAIQESTLTNLSGGDRDSLGIFQQRPSMEWGSRSQIQNLDFAIDSFFEGRGSNPGMLDNRSRAGGDVYHQSHLTQRSAHPNAPRQWDQEAQSLVYAFSQVDGGQVARTQAASRIARNNVASHISPWERGIASSDREARASSTGGPVTLNITVNVNGAGSNVRQEVYEGAAAAVDEFEQRWRSGQRRSQPESSSDYSYS